ncbi:hypothetical protein [Glycomyces xiaoerkulensis]|uniref:hypothetical protein n=1 Tax=Glycomyces xiaoerkulensis TaxID=2038139 RepID=UPI000C25B597|nr:hypothetical protein [Glycomyces xiaoerkulensis]
MSDRNGNVYGGGTYRGGTYRAGGNGGRHHSEEEEAERREAEKPSVEDDDGTIKVARNGGAPDSPPRPPEQQHPAPQPAPPPTQPGAPHTYGATAPGNQPQPQSPARGGQGPQSPARGGQAPGPQSPARGTGTPQAGASPRPPHGVPPRAGQGPASQPPPTRPPAPPPQSGRQGPAARPPQQPRPQGPPPSQQQPPQSPVSAAPVSGGSPAQVSPASVQPVSGQPVSGQPVSGQPFSGQPASAQPYSGVPYSGAAPLSGGPVSSTPTSAGLFGVSQVSAGPTEGTVYGLPVTDRAVATASEAGKAVEPLRPMPQIPTARALELMTSASPPSGLVIGRDAEQVPVVAPLFRPEETRVNLIGGVYLARLLVFRALALGTRVAVCTARPQEWNGLGEAATGRGDRLAVLHGDQPVTVDASQHSPALYVYDVGERGSQTKPVLGPWRTQLTVLPRLTNFADSLTAEAHMTVLQRLTAEEAQIARSSIRVNQEVLQWLQMLHDDMVAMLRKGQKEKYLWCAPTSIESQMFGQPMRTY